MKITKFEQSGFLLEGKEGFKLAIDIGAYTPLEKLSGISPDAMFVSHLHADHLSPDQIGALLPTQVYLSQECIDALAKPIPGEIIRIKAGETVTVGSATVSTFDVDHGTNISVIPKENFGFLIEMDGEKIYFAGDMFYPSGLDVSTLEVDYALIPVGTFYTFGPQEALEFVKKFKKIGQVIPMHYQKTPQTKDEFIKLAQENDIGVA